MFNSPTLFISVQKITFSFFPDDIWVKVFKNGSSEICGRQHKQTIFLKFFKGCLPQILPGPFLNTLTHITLRPR